jgi:pyruvate formate lyase activating enzyme
VLFAGIQKLTLLDYPRHVACTLFTQGCGYRCPFCHNSSLLPFTEPEQPLTEEAVLAFLKKRQGTLDGVCFTGGEPLMQDDLADFIRRVRALGFLVKLDTNGSQPERLRSLIDSRLIDMVAMDIKNAPCHYARTVGIPNFDLSPVQESIDLLMSGSVTFEFRTTVVDELHGTDDMEAMAEWLAGSESYYLQYFVNEDSVLWGGLHAPSKEKMQAFLQILRKKIPNAHIRGEEDT